jgi:hypothetical protein
MSVPEAIGLFLHLLATLHAVRRVRALLGAIRIAAASASTARVTLAFQRIVRGGVLGARTSTTAQE